MKYKILALITPLVFALDQLTKALIRADLDLGERVSVIGGYLDIVHFTNYGAAFGILSNLKDSIRTPFFYGVSVLAVVIIFVMFAKLKRSSVYLPVVFSLILGGIFGNLTDRIRFGEVTDFISVHIRDAAVSLPIIGLVRLEWPAFNIADSAITIAVILILIGAIFFKEERS